jgi:2-polyprenyl-6-methoxyphenol hydroxylase-like FAD-dependent oxidoreductase
VQRKEELLARFGDWHEPIPSIIRATEETHIHRDGVYYREPSARWGEGRVTLLGDAAHPMTPDLGQGACQAIEDALVLMGSLGENGDVEAALRLYEGRRAERTAYVVRQSRRLGRIAQLENPLACRLRDAVLRVIPSRVQLGMQLRQMEALVGYEA